MNKIIVTGGAGFIGSHLSEKLSNKNKVIVIDNFMHGNKIIKQNKNLKIIKGDVRDFDLLKFHSRGCDTIFHLAAVLGVDVVSKRNVDTMELEYEGMRNVCYVSKVNKIKKILYTSTSGVYGKLNYAKNVHENNTVAPLSAYAVAKRSAEIYLKNFFLENKKIISTAIALRLFNIYGPRQDSRMVASRFIINALKNKKLSIYGSGKQTRDFTYINDCIEAMILLDKKIKGFHILNISKEKDININKLAREVVKITKSKSKIVHIKTPKKLEEFQVDRRCGNSSKLYKIINFKPKTSYSKGLIETINYIKNTSV
jgi:UDP-glucose 4-epimerase